MAVAKTTTMAVGYSGASKSTMVGERARGMELGFVYGVGRVLYTLGAHRMIDTAASGAWTGSQTPRHGVISFSGKRKEKGRPDGLGLEQGK